MNNTRIINKAFETGYAIGAFNITDIDMLYGALDAADSLKSDIIIQTSESFVKYYSPTTISKIFGAVFSEYDGEIILHLDHCSDIELIKRCVDAGWDSVMIDASHLELDMNIQSTNLISDYRKGMDVIVECEIGEIKGEEDGSKSTSSGKVKKEDLEKYLPYIEADMVAIGIGNKHGHYETDEEDDIDLGILEMGNEIRRLPLVLHGGTGIGNEKIQSAIKMGTVKINVSTALKEVFYKNQYDWVKSASRNNVSAKKSLRASVSDFVKSKIIEFNPKLR